jgi:hypothetical protein
MPLTFGAAIRLVDKTVLNSLAVSERVSSTSKDIWLPEAEILLPWPPIVLLVRHACLVLMAAGSCWLFLVGRPITAGTIKSGDA